MYRIKGLYEVTGRTVPFVFSDKEIAKFKLLYGSVATSLDAYIRDELFKSKLILSIGGVSIDIVILFTMFQI